MRGGGEGVTQGENESVSRPQSETLVPFMGSFHTCAHFVTRLKRLLFICSKNYIFKCQLH